MQSEFQLLAYKYYFWPLCLFELKSIIMVKFQHIFCSNFSPLKYTKEPNVFTSDLICMHFPQITIKIIVSGSLEVHGYGQVSQIWPCLAYSAISRHYQMTRMYVHDGYLRKVHQNYRSLVNFYRSIACLQQMLRPITD